MTGAAVDQGGSSEKGPDRERLTSSWTGLPSVMEWERTEAPRARPRLLVSMSQWCALNWILPQPLRPQRFS